MKKTINLIKLNRGHCMKWASNVIQWSYEWKQLEFHDKNRSQKPTGHGHELGPDLVKSQRHVMMTMKITLCRGVDVDLVANCSSSLPSYVISIAPDNALPLSEDPDGILHPALH
ncbi:hypothetical protein TNCV_2233851 [Trichonephila clavipes]|nr:hypothetical protein TNCV_2233851 [Trichonephila clavipes]